MGVTELEPLFEQDRKLLKEHPEGCGGDRGVSSCGKPLDGQHSGAADVDLIERSRFGVW